MGKISGFCGTILVLSLHICNFKNLNLLQVYLKYVSKYRKLIKFKRNSSITIIPLFDKLYS